jgi:hypothetical protein
MGRNEFFFDMSRVFIVRSRFLRVSYIKKRQMWNLLWSWLLGVIMTSAWFSIYPQMATILFFVRGMLHFQLTSVYYRCRMRKSVKTEAPSVPRRQLRPPTLNVSLISPIMETPNLSPHEMKNGNGDSIHESQ